MREKNHICDNRENENKEENKQERKKILRNIYNIHTNQQRHERVNRQGKHRYQINKKNLGKVEEELLLTKK
jgi:hypothetical protein